MSSKQKALLIIGAGIEQVYAYKLAKEQGHIVIGTDVNSDAPAFSEADYKIIVSTRDAESTLSEVIKFQQEKNITIHGVMTVANDVPLTVATLSNYLNLEGLSIESAQYSSNKLLMKNKLKDANVSVTPFFPVNNYDEAIDVINTISFPVIIKPVDGRGSRNVFYIRSEDDLIYVKKIFEIQKSQILVEKFYDGQQLSTESMILNNKCYTAGISVRNYERLEQFSPYVIEDGGTLPANLDEMMIKKIDSLLLKAAKALNYSKGSIKGDIVIHNGSPYLIEVALRLSGGFFCTHQIPKTSGVDLVLQTINLSLGEQVFEEDLVPHNKCYMATRYFFPKTGQLKSIKGFTEIQKNDWIFNADIFLKPGDKINNITSHADRVGFIQALGSTYEEAVKRANLTISSVEFELENINEKK
jgi:biotin carboxylase